VIKIEMKGFDGLTRRLQRMARDVETTAGRLNRTMVSTPLTPDENGFIDRCCPSCSFLFKIAADNPSGEVSACPSCGHREPGARWETPAQRARSIDNARAHATTSVRAAFSGIRRADFGVARGYSGISSGINVMRDGRWVVVGLPAPATAALQSERTCTECGCRFSFIGSVFFCPACGGSSPDANFAQTLGDIRRAVVYCRALHETLPDEAAIIERAILEKAMADLVTAFQMVAESLYTRISGISPPLNAFQRLEGANGGSALWHAATGRSYADYLDATDLRHLRTYFQRRHVLAHRNGFVDQVYLDRSADTAYRVGQRLVVRTTDIEDLAHLVEKLVIAMRGQ